MNHSQSMDDCAICGHADETGSWPVDHRGTHCRDCHRSWAAIAQSHCAACHRHFGSDSAGDAHRIGGECHDPKGFDVWQTDAGPIFGGKDPQAARERMRRARAARLGSVVKPGATL